MLTILYIPHPWYNLFIVFICRVQSETLKQESIIKYCRIFNYKVVFRPAVVTESVCLGDYIIKENLPYFRDSFAVSVLITTAAALHRMLTTSEISCTS